MTWSTAAAGFDVGNRITYLAGRQRSQPRRLCRRGIVAGQGVRDKRTDTTWIPVHTDSHPDEAAPEWVRADDVIDVVP